MVHRCSWLVVAALALAGCGDDDPGTSSGDGGAGSGAASGGPGSDGTGSDGTLLDPPDGSVEDGGDGLSPGQPLGGAFRRGINGGYPNPAWNDVQLAGLEVRAGCNGQRLSLPEQHLDRWGWEIELGDMASYQELGLEQRVAFLSAPIREHSTAPSSAKDWELVHYLPKNLYEPILLEDGRINPDNYWGHYVYQTVETYRDYVRVWEIWNEPDYVKDWRIVGEWEERAPTANDLPRFHGSVFDYVRMLRVSKIAAQLADPEALIATGGIGYATFLDAVLRSTDDPKGGDVGESHPYTGAAYIDVLSFHHYPVYTPGTSDDGVAGYLDHFQELLAVVRKYDVELDGWITTETGAPHLAVDDFPGGDEYARNYYLKVMVSAQAAGIDGVDWFVLADGALPGESDDPYSYMGLYRNVAELEEPDDAVLTETGVAAATLGALLEGARFDPELTASEDFGPGVRAFGFEMADGTAVWSLWAIATDSEEASATVTLDGQWTAHPWDESATQKTTSVTGSFELDATPVFLTAN